MNWKSITGYENLYLVSDTGQVKSLRYGKLLRGTVNTQGYLVVGLYKNNTCRICTIHRLVAFEFHSLSYFVGAHVNHKDGDKLNNNISNLEWVTQAENIRHSFRVLGRKTNNPLNCSKSKPIAQLHADTLEIISIYPSSAEAVRVLGKSSKSTAIRNCINGVSNTCYGFKWIDL